MTDPLRCRLLGPPSVENGTGPLDLGPPKQRVLVAALLLAEGRPVAASALVDAVWGHEPPASALATLRTYISRLRGVLGSSLRRVGNGYALEYEALDLTDFRLLAAAAGRSEAAQEKRLLAEALALWSGEALAGLPGDFAAAQRTRLAELRLSARERSLTLDVRHGGNPGVIAELTALCASHPYRETLHGLLMTALCRAGRQAEALAVYDDLRHGLAGELGIDPGPELTALHRRILRGDPELGAAPDVPAPAQLPADLGDFTGRAGHVERLADDLATRGTAPVVRTVCGVGGIGKTSLALHVAHRVRPRFPDGQLYADLRGGGAEPLSPAQVLAGFLRALGHRGEIPSDVDERAAAYRSALAERSVLVVLDNAFNAAQIRPLLPAAPTCAVLVTSRAKLADLAGAVRVDLDALPPGEALDLFTAIVGPARVRAEPGAAETLLGLCGRLPLAVRLAAARLAARPGWDLAAFAARLADENRRLRELAVGDQAVEAGFALSYEQLDADRAEAFRLLAAPAAPDLALPTAAAILGVAEDAAEDLAESLVDLSLLESHRPGRYRFHDLVRLYAGARCGTAEHERAVERFLDFHLATTINAQRVAYPDHRLSGAAAVGSPGISFTAKEPALDWLHQETDGTLPVLRQAATAGAVPIAAELLGPLAGAASGASVRRDYVTAAREIAEAARRIGDARSEARARVRLARVHLFGGEPAEGRTEADAALRLAEAVGDIETLAEAHRALGSAAYAGGSAAESLPHVRAAYDRLAAAGWRKDAATVQADLARALLEAGRDEDSITEIEDCVKVLRDHDDETALVWGLFQYGCILDRLGRADEAVAVLREALPIRRRVRHPVWERHLLFRLAEAELHAGLPHDAAVHAEEAVAMYPEVENEYWHGYAVSVLGTALAELGRTGRAIACLHQALDVFTRTGAEDRASLLRPLLTRLAEQGASH